MNPTWPLPASVLDYLFAQMLTRQARAIVGDLDGQATFYGMWAVRVERAKRGSRR
jgi:hypothetical protein